MNAINYGGIYLMSAAYLARGGGPLTDAQAPYSGMDTPLADRPSGPLLRPRHRVVSQRGRHQAGGHELRRRRHLLADRFQRRSNPTWSKC